MLSIHWTILCASSVYDICSYFSVNYTDIQLTLTILKRWLSSEHTRTDFRRMLSFCLKNYRDLSICLTNMQMLSRNRRNHISWKVCKLEQTNLFSYMLLFYVNAQHMQKSIIFGDTGDYSLSQIRIDSKTPAITPCLVFRSIPRHRRLIHRFRTAEPLSSTALRRGMRHTLTFKYIHEFSQNLKLLLYGINYSGPWGENLFV